MNGPKKVKLTDLTVGWRVALNADASGYRWLAGYAEVVRDARLRLIPRPHRTPPS